MTQQRTPDRRSLIARRRRNLLLAALAAFVLGIVAGALSDGGEPARDQRRRARAVRLRRRAPAPRPPSTG